MSDKEKRSHIRIKGDKLIDIGDDSNDRVELTQNYHKPVEFRRDPLNVNTIGFQHYDHNSVFEVEAIQGDDRAIISMYADIPLTDLETRLIGMGEISGLNSKLAYLPFWFDLTIEEQKEISNLYLLYYVETIRYEAYSNISEISKEDTFENNMSSAIADQNRLAKIIGSKLKDYIDDGSVLSAEIDEVAETSEVHSEITLYLSSKAKELRRRMI